MKNIEYAYFPGCSADSTGIAYTKSFSFIAACIGLEMHEIDDWCCCGTSAAKITSDDLSRALPARSLALGERQLPGLDVIAPCTGCYSSLKAAVAYARESDENRSHVSDLIEMDYAAKADVKSLLEVFAEPEVKERIVAGLARTLGGMKVACYYGCMQSRPADIVQFGDDVENPTAMDELLEACGAECVDWSFKTECCGASNHVVAPEAARRVVERIYRNARANGAECIVTSCPLCWLNLDMRQTQVNKEMGTDYELPVYYFTELIAMCMGASGDEVGLAHHFTEAKALAEGRVGGPSGQDAEEVSAHE